MTVIANKITNIRKKTNLNQREFAEALNISIGTLRNWEQGHRNPDGAAITLLKIIDRHPELLNEIKNYNEL